MEYIQTTQQIRKPPYSYKDGTARLIRLIAFDKEGRILAIKRADSFDIIRGRQEWDDDTHEDAVRREAEEQANASLCKISLAAMIENKSETNETNGKSTFELVMTAFVQTKGPRSVWQDNESEFIDKETFLKSYSSGDSEEMKTLIKMAEHNLFDAPVSQWRKRERCKRKNTFFPSPEIESKTMRS